MKKIIKKYISPYPQGLVVAYSYTSNFYNKLRNTIDKI